MGRVIDVLNDLASFGSPTLESGLTSDTIALTYDKQNVLNCSSDNLSDNCDITVAMKGESFQSLTEL